MFSTSTAESANGLDALLAGYASGGLNRHLHALVAAHLDLRPANRGFVAALEKAKADAMLEAEPFAISARGERLAAIFGSKPTLPLVPDLSHATFPAPLRDLVGCDAGAAPWRWVLPGVRECHVGVAGDGEAKLYKIAPKRRLPSHTHQGSEITLVLRGGFSDASGHYQRGDIAFADSETDHKPVADAGEDCICFAVTDAPLQLTGPVWRWVSHVIGSRH